MSEARCRLDVWLWRGRFFKTRSLAATAVQDGVFVMRRGQGRTVDKPAFAVEPEDGLTFRCGKSLRTVRILALGVRRGPASEAQALYEDLGATDKDA